MTPIIEFDGVSKWYGNVIGLNKLTLRLPSGVTGLLGPNGAGKSTLLQLATGQLRPSQGTVRVLGQPVWNNPALNRSFGLCPEQDAFYEWMTGMDFVRTCARLSGMRRPAAQAAAETALALVGMTPNMRPGLYLCKLLATLLLTTVLVAAATTGLYLAIYWNSTQMWDGSVAMRMVQTAAIMALGQVGYCSLFGCLGVLTRRTLIAGVLYIVVFEGLLANLQFMVRSLTVVYYIRVLAVRWLDLPDQILTRWRSDWGLDLNLIPDGRTCVLILLGSGLAITVLSALQFSRREFRMKTPEGG